MEYNLKIRNIPRVARSKRLREAGGQLAGAMVTKVTVENTNIGLGGGSSHEHTNLDTLERLGTDYLGYGYVDGQKVKAGYADVAADLTADSPVRSQFLSRIQSDIAQGKITFERGVALLGVSTIDGPLQTSGYVSDLYAGNGFGLDTDTATITANRLRLRDSLEVISLLVNRIQALDGDTIHTESDTIDRIVEGEPNGEGLRTFDLYVKSKWDGYFTAFTAGAVIKGVYNSLADAALKGTVAQGTESAEHYFTSWLHVNDVFPTQNRINVTMYAPDRCPAGVNHAPIEDMVIVRWGHATDTQRQSSVVISSSERRIMMLQGVTKPIIDRNNYGVAIGKPLDFMVSDYGVSPLDNALYVKRLFFETSHQVRVDGLHPITYVDEGIWYYGCDPKCDRAIHDESSPYDGQWVTSRMWHDDCLWQCVEDGTTAEPRYDSTDWVLISGNRNFAVEFDGYSESDRYDFANFSLTLNLRAWLGYKDVTADINPVDVEWTRHVVDSEGNEKPNSDAAWAASKAGAGMSLTLTKADIGSDGIPQSLTYTATVTLRDGVSATATLNII